MNDELILRGTNLSEEFNCQLGDARLTRRLQRVGEAMSHHPELSLPEMLEDDAETEGAYRLLRNQKLSLGNVVAEHVAATAQRCAPLGEVLVVHDTTEFSFPRNDHDRRHLSRLSTTRQGFFAHVSIAVSADGLRAPLGTLRCRPYVHTSQVEGEAKAFWHAQSGIFESEGHRWVESIRDCDEKLASGDARAVHVCDREADRNDVLEYFTNHDIGFVIRGFQARKTTAGVPIYDVAAKGKVLARRTITLSERSLQKPRDSHRSGSPRDRRPSGTSSQQWSPRLAKARTWATKATRARAGSSTHSRSPGRVQIIEPVRYGTND